MDIGIFFVAIVILQAVPLSYAAISLVRGGARS